MIFQDRQEATLLLAEKLKKYRGKNPLILGIPRGAIPMAEILAEKLGGELGAVLVHKIPAPGFPELAIAAVGISGHIYRLPTIEELGVSDEYLHEAAQEQIQVLKERQRAFHLGDLKCKDRIVIIVDDGIATGASAMAAILEVKSQKPQKLVVATPTIAKSTADQIRPMVDELVTMMEPDFFFAVSQFYSDFSQVSDREVAQIFEKEIRHRPHDAHPSTGQ